MGGALKIVRFQHAPRVNKDITRRTMPMVIFYVAVKVGAGEEI